MRYISSQTENRIRVVALSASLANGKDLGEWIGASAHGLFNFHPNSRPVPLEIHLQGFDSAHFESSILSMSKPTLLALSNHWKEKPVILFAPSKKHAIRIAGDIKVSCDADAQPRRYLRISDESLKSHLEVVKSKVLRRLLEYGIGLYHEALLEEEKIVVEELFRSGAILLLIATNDMCWGMNLMCHLVIIMILILLLMQMKLLLIKLLSFHYLLKNMLGQLSHFL